MLVHVTPREQEKSLLLRVSQSVEGLAEAHGDPVGRRDGTIQACVWMVGVGGGGGAHSQVPLQLSR